MPSFPLLHRRQQRRFFPLPCPKDLGPPSRIRWWRSDTRTVPPWARQPGWGPPSPPGWKCPPCCWRVLEPHRQLANTRNPLLRCPCCWWHLWDPGWEQSRSCSPRRSTGTPPGPISELFNREAAQLHPASPALLPAPGQQLLATPAVLSSAVVVWTPGAVLEQRCKHRAWPYSCSLRSNTGQAVSSVRGESSGGSGVLLPPESTSPGSPCSARNQGRGSTGRRGGHALSLGKTSSKSSKVSTTRWGSPRLGEPIQTPVGFASDLTSLTEASLQKYWAPSGLMQRFGPRVGVYATAAGGLRG